MDKRKNYAGIFSILIVVSVLLFALWRAEKLNFVTGITSKIFSSPQGALVSAVFKNQNLDIEKISKDLNLIKINKENAALRDQFAVSNPNPSKLLPAKIIGAPTFIPTQTLPDYFILDKGEKDGVKKGDGVVWRDNLLGQITELNSFSSKVTLINSNSTSFTGKLESGAIGVVKGLGDTIEIDNVLLSENINKDGVVLTKGNQDISGVGVPPDLIVGKIVSVDRDPSALFQRAKIQTLIDLRKIDMVFIVVK